MRSVPALAAITLSSALLAGFLGWHLASSRSAARISTLESELAQLRMRSDAEPAPRAPQPLEDRSPESLARPGSPGEAANARPAVDPAAGLAGAAATAEGEPEAAMGPAARAARVADLIATSEAKFQEGDGKAVLATLLELAEVVPEGREAAMALAIRINEDVNGANTLKLPTMTYYTALSDLEMKDLMLWSFDNESPADFRVMASYSLPWIQPVEKTIEAFRALLEHEQNGDVQRAVVANLASTRAPEALKVLGDMFRDRAHDAVLRSVIAPALALSDDPDVVASIEDAATKDPDETVRRAAKVALAIRRPPASGFLITGTLPQSQAESAGLETGDVIVTYGGRNVRSLEDLRAAASGASDRQEVPIVVFRDGREVTYYLRPGQMGIFGRGVEKSEER